MQSSLFDPAEINGLTIKNRFVRSGTFEGMATFEGRPAPGLKDLYIELADGEVGLIITGLTHVDGYKDLPDIEGAPFPLAMDNDRLVGDWKGIIGGVHQNGGIMTFLYSWLAETVHLKIYPGLWRMTQPIWFPCPSRLFGSLD